MSCLIRRMWIAMLMSQSTLCIMEVLGGLKALILSRICLSLSQDLHELLTVTYGLPVWASYTIFGVSTVLIGILLGVVSFYEPSYSNLSTDEELDLIQMSHNFINTILWAHDLSSY